jgi:hypothetical protein
LSILHTSAESVTVDRDAKLKELKRLTPGHSPKLSPKTNLSIPITPFYPTGSLPISSSNSPTTKSAPPPRATSNFSSTAKATSGPPVRIAPMSKSCMTFRSTRSGRSTTSPISFRSTPRGKSRSTVPNSTSDSSSKSPTGIVARRPALVTSALMDSPAARTVSPSRRIFFSSALSAKWI